MPSACRRSELKACSTGAEIRGVAQDTVLRKPLGELAARTYRVTGPWQDPQVEVVGRGPPRTASAGSPPPG